MSEPAFDQLRTKEQLGYIVFSGIKKVSTLLCQCIAAHLMADCASPYPE